MKKLVIIILVIGLYASLYADFTYHTESEIDTILQFWDPDGDATMGIIGSTGDWSEKIPILDNNGQFYSTMYNAVQQPNIAVPQRMEITSDDDIADWELYNNQVITNQGATSEIDITLSAISYDLCRLIKLEEDYIIEIGCPSGEQFYLEGDGWLTADHVIDSPATYPATMMICRGKNNAGNWRYFAYPVLGTWVDSGLTD